MARANVVCAAKHCKIFFQPPIAFESVKYVRKHGRCMTVVADVFKESRVRLLFLATVRSVVRNSDLPIDSLELPKETVTFLRDIK